MFQADLLRGKKALVTGGGTGLGKSMGRRFLELGAELVICGRREEVLEETVSELTCDGMFTAAAPLPERELELDFLQKALNLKAPGLL